MYVFRCPKCLRALPGFRPDKCDCGHGLPVIDGVYQFTDDAPIAIGDHELRWLGYEKVGENYESAYALAYKQGHFGIFGSAARLLAGMLDRDAVVLDLGAGLGQAAIPLAMENIATIAIDISQRMIGIAAKRAKEHDVTPEKFICVRMNAYQLFLDDNSIDAVLAIDVLHQLDHPELAIKEIKRVLKKDGFLARYGNKNIDDFTAEQTKENAAFNEALKDITAYYNDLVSGYSEPPFSSWEKVENCLKEEFEEPETYESDEIITVIWNLELGLHKTKTRASGSKQLIPDAVHDEAWRKTEEYAVNKYGADYKAMQRTYKMKGIVNVYRPRY